MGYTGNFFFNFEISKNDQVLGHLKPCPDTPWKPSKLGQIRGNSDG